MCRGLVGCEPFFPFLSPPLLCRTAATKNLDESLSMRSHHQFDGRSEQIFHFIQFHGSGISIGLSPPRTIKSIVVSVADQIVRTLSAYVWCAYFPFECRAIHRSKIDHGGSSNKDRKRVENIRVERVCNWLSATNFIYSRQQSHKCDIRAG